MGTLAFTIAQATPNFRVRFDESGKVTRSFSFRVTALYGKAVLSNGSSLESIACELTCYTEPTRVMGSAIDANKLLWTPAFDANDGTQYPEQISVQLVLDEARFNELLAIGLDGRFPRKLFVESPSIGGVFRADSRGPLWDIEKSPTVDVGEFEFFEIAEAAKGASSAELARAELALLARRTEGLNRYSQKRRIVHGVLRGVRDWAIKTGKSAEEFEDAANEALGIVDSLQRITNPLSQIVDGQFLTQNVADRYLSKLSATEREKPQVDWIWVRRSLSFAFSGGENSSDYWPCNQNEVSGLVNEYLSAPWACCAELELLMVDVLVYQEALNFGDEVKHKSFDGTLFREKMEKTQGRLDKLKRPEMWRDMAQELFVFLLCAGLGLAAANVLGVWAGVLVFILLGAVLRIRSTLLHAVGNKEREKWGAIYSAMTSVYMILGQSPLSPSHVRASLLAAQEKGVIWPAGTLALVQHAENRNPVLWVN